MVDEYLQPNAAFNRLYDEWKKYKSLVIAFDFDNTVYDFHKKGSTYEQVITLLREYKAIGCRMVCFTAGENQELIRTYCKEKEIPLDAINENPAFFKSKSGKIYYSALLDDRAGLMQVYSDLSLLLDLIRKEDKEKATLGTDEQQQTAQ